MPTNYYRIPEPPAGAQIYLTTQSAVARGITKHWLFNWVKPDAWAASASGDKAYPLWLVSTVEAAIAERAAGPFHHLKASLHGAVL